MPKFYNAGNKIDEVFMFSLPDGADVHVVGRWPFVAPKESWFDVPTEINVGVATISVKFADDIKRRFGKRGVVMLDPSWKIEQEDPDKPVEFYALASTAEAVVERAELLWNNYIEDICKAHFEDVQNAMSAGGAPRAAKGFTAHALKLRGYQDPAERYFLAQKEGQQAKAAGISPEVAGVLAQMQQQNQAMMTMVMAIVTGQKVDPATLAHLMPQTPAPIVPTAPPENAGAIEVEGAGTSSLEQRIHRRDDGYIRGEGNLDKGTLKIKNTVAPKQDRTAAAAKQL